MHYLYTQGYHTSISFFLAFVIVTNFLLLNLFIAVILENFADITTSEREDELKLKQEHLVQFAKAWSLLDPDHNNYIQSFNLVPLLYQIPPPIGFKGTIALRSAGQSSAYLSSFNRYVLSYIRSLNLKRDLQGHIYFLDVLSSLVKKAFVLQDIDVEEMMDSMEEEIDQFVFRHGQTHKNVLFNSGLSMSKDDWVDVDLSEEFNAATALQMIWQEKKVREHVMRRLHPRYQAEQRMNMNRRANRWAFLVPSSRRSDGVVAYNRDQQEAVHGMADIHLSPDIEEVLHRLDRENREKERVKRRLRKGSEGGGGMVEMSPSRGDRPVGQVMVDDWEGNHREGQTLSSLLAVLQSSAEGRRREREARERALRYGGLDNQVVELSSFPPMSTPMRPSSTVERKSEEEEHVRGSERKKRREARK